MEEGLGGRLETVRAETDLSLRAFWRKVVGDEGGGRFEWSEEGDPSQPAVGYRTVTRYHRGEREAPVGYLRRVAEVFNVRLAWLVAEEGPMTREHVEVERVSRFSLKAETARRRYRVLRLQWRVLNALGKDHPPPPQPPDADSVDSPESSQWRAEVETAFRTRRIHPWVGPLSEALRRAGPSSTEPVQFPLGSGTDLDDVCKALGDPLRALAVDTERMSADAINAYVLSMVPVLLSLAEAPSQRPLQGRLRAARKDLEDAREDDLAPEVVARLKERVEGLEEEIRQEERTHEEIRRAEEALRDQGE